MCEIDVGYYIGWICEMNDLSPKFTATFAEQKLSLEVYLQIVVM